MSYQVNFEQRSGYLYFEVTGTNSREVVYAYMQDILEECEKHDCFLLLVNEKLSGPRLETMDIFNVASEGAMRALGRFDAVAYVDEEMGEMGDFAESVAVNRGIPMAFFSNVKDAERWIEYRSGNADDQYIFWNGRDNEN